MKKKVLATLLVGFFLLMTASSVLATAIFGPKQYLRTTGAPNIYEDTFVAVQGPGVLTIRNGEPDGGHRVTSAYIFVNGVQIYGPDDFKQFTHVMDVPLELSPANDLRVELRSKPDTYLTIAFTQAPPEVSLAADPVRIRLGDSSVLTWTSAMAAKCVIEPGPGTVELNGSIAISPTESTTYEIIATAPAGTASASAQVTVVPPPVVQFAADPVTIIEGDATVLTWSTQYADTVAIEPGIGPVETNGSMSVSPMETTTYTLTAVGWAGTTLSEVTVTVIPKPKAGLSIAPQTIIEGESAVLTWTTQHADTVTIEPGIGPVDKNGSMPVSPTETTTYIITATGPGGTASTGVTVTVIPLPKITITAIPETIIEGQSCGLSWVSQHSDSVTIDNGIGAVALAGTLSVSPIETTTYLISSTGPGGTATASVTVTVIPKPKAGLSIAPQTIIEGESTTLTWTTQHADTVTIEPGIGAVDANGSMPVSMTETTTYTLTATGPGGDRDSKRHRDRDSQTQSRAFHCAPDHY